MPSDPPLGAELDDLIDAALAEDVGGGDVTSTVVCDAETRAAGRLVAKATGVVAGLGVFARVFERLDAEVKVEPRARDGQTVRPGMLLATLEGRAQALLMGERTALNFLQRMSGVATLTRGFVERVAGRARVLDTRKTTPGLRRLEKYAVLCGGGENHRFGLFDEVMVKDNHVDLSGRGLRELVQTLRERHGSDMRITAEARDGQEALAAVAGGADVVLLDNLTPDELTALCPDLRAAARERGRPVELEASGGVDLESAAGVAGSGVDRVSIGALTHSAPALDLSLTLEALP